MTHHSWSSWLERANRAAVRADEGATPLVVTGVAAMLSAWGLPDGRIPTPMMTDLGRRRREIEKGEFYGIDYDDLVLRLSMALGVDGRAIRSAIWFLVEADLLTVEMDKGGFEARLGVLISSDRSTSAERVIEAILASDMPASRKARVVRHVVSMAGGGQ